MTSIYAWLLPLLPVSRIAKVPYSVCCVAVVYLYHAGDVWAGSDDVYKYKGLPDSEGRIPPLSSDAVGIRVPDG